MTSKLGLSKKKIGYARRLARVITKPVDRFIKQHTTVTVERATLRVLGADGVDKNNIPVPNLVVNALEDKIGLGVARYYIDALLQKGFSVSELNHAIARGLNLADISLSDMSAIKELEKAGG